MAEPVLDAFGIGSDTLLGQGIESRVFALDADRVLRIPRADKPEEVAQRAAFYAELSRHSLPFAVPRVLDAGRIAGQGFTVEARLPGRALLAALADPGFRARDIALDAMARIPDALEMVDLSHLPYGDLLGAEPIRTERWSAFLARRVARELARSEDRLRREVPALDARRDAFQARLDALPDPPRRLVHGDLYPGNVLVDDDGAITALVDFSSLSVVGDTDLDRTGALEFLTPGMSPPVTDAERAAAARATAARRGPGWSETRRTYRLYYALLFSDCATFDPDTYRWLVDVLR